MKKQLNRWAALGLLGAACAGAQADVTWDRYRGSANVTSATTPNYDNAGGGVDTIDRLLTFSASNAAASTGNSAQANWRSADHALCDDRVAPPTAACTAGLMGQVAYTVIRFPQAGTYTLAANHDDAVGIDTANSAGATDFRTLTYQAGPRLPRWTAETTSETLTTVNVTRDEACMLVRLSWNNWGGFTHFGLHWSGPGITGTELIPADNLLAPGSANAGCALPLDAVDDVATLTAPTAAITIPVTDNDTAAIGGAIDPASVALVTAPAVGTVTCSAGTCTYTPPAAGLLAPTTFTYRVCQQAPNDSVCDVATVTVNPFAAPAAVPTTGQGALLLLSGLLGAAAWRRRKNAVARG